jgi:hypothetical protein
MSGTMNHTPLGTVPFDEIENDGLGNLEDQHSRPRKSKTKTKKGKMKTNTSERKISSKDREKGGTTKAFSTSESIVGMSGTTNHTPFGTVPFDEIENDGLGNLEDQHSRPRKSKTKTKKGKMKTNTSERKISSKDREKGGTTKATKPCRNKLSESTPRPARMSQIFRSTQDLAFCEESKLDETEMLSVLRTMEDVKLSFDEDTGSANWINPCTSIESSLTSEHSSIVHRDIELGPHEGDKKDPKENKSDKKYAMLDSIKHQFRSFRKDMVRFKLLKLLQVLLAIYVGVLTYADIGPPGGLRDPETGLIVDQESAERTEKGLILVNGVERSIVAATQFQVVCIGITRMSAFFMYPGRFSCSFGLFPTSFLQKLFAHLHTCPKRSTTALVMVFASKFRATITFLSKSPFAMYMYKDSHELHVYCGWTILIFAAIHTIFHIARWAQQGNLYLLVQHFSGLSGFFIISSCLLISIPMTILRTQIRFEIRKNLHYLFIVFGGALMFHTPTSAIPNGGFTAWVFSITLVWYFIDATYCFFYMTEKIDTTKFSVVNCGVRMTMTVSDRFQKMGNQGGVCYVCLPWIDRNQWHAFSLFEDPANPGERQIFIQKTGDWTTQVHRVLQRDTVRPAWIQGPFPSPYDNAIAYDNQILVASGIGITPALSVIRAHKDTRRINLVWAVRDEALLEFFLKHLYLDHDGWNFIFYTGKKKLRNQCVHLEADTNVCIISGRPNLKELIPNIIFGIESGLGLPENYTPGTKMAASELLAAQLLASSDCSTTGTGSDDDAIEDLALQASELGFNLSTDAVSHEFGIAGSRTANRDLSASVNMAGFRRAAKSRLADSARLSASIRENLSIGFRPWNCQEGANKYVKNLDKKLVLQTWGMLYCGGAKPVLNVLEEISDEFDIGLHVESFAW